MALKTAANDPLVRFSELELAELAELADAAHTPIGYADRGHCPACAEQALQRRIAAQRAARAARRRALVSLALATTQDSRQFLAAWLAARSAGSRREPVPW